MMKEMMTRGPNCALATAASAMVTSVWMMDTTLPPAQVTGNTQAIAEVTQSGWFVSAAEAPAQQQQRAYRT